VNFKILSGITDIENIAVTTSIRDLERLERKYGKGNWKKRKGFARVQFDDGYITIAELHWYEAHGIGQYEFKIKEWGE
jgi:hypothetical protein